MATTVKNSLYWALTALQIAPTDNGCGTNVLTFDKPHSPHKSHASANTKDKVADSENVKPVFSRDAVNEHFTHDSCWIIINNKVYDVTRFLRMHPGGEDIILEHGGRDATSVFIDKGHSPDAYDSLADFFIGEVTQEDCWPEKHIT